MNLDARLTLFRLVGALCCLGFVGFLSRALREIWFFPERFILLLLLFFFALLWLRRSPLWAPCSFALFLIVVASDYRPTEFWGNELSETEIRVVSANVQSWGGGLEGALERIGSVNPDVLLLQEVWSPEHLESAHEAFPRFRFYGNTEWWATSGVFIGVRASLQVNGVVADEDFVSVTLALEEGGVEFVNVHGKKVHDYSLSGLESSRRLQRRQAAKIGAFLGSKVRKGLVVAGDFNSTSSLTWEDELEPLGLVPVRFSLTPWSEASFPAPLPLWGLDRVYSTMGSHRAYRLDTGSDHLAGVVLLALPSKAALGRRGLPLISEPARDG